MKTTICKIAVFLLLFSITLTCFSGCKRESDEEFIAIASDLLSQSTAVNEICFGEGLAYDEKNGYITNGYVEASEEAKQKYGVQTAEEIKALIARVYSVSVVDYIDKVVFQPVREGSTILSYRRYFDAMDGEGGVALMVKKDYEPAAYGKVTYENLQIESHSRARATILVDIHVTDGENKHTYEGVPLNMRFEGDGWRFDTVTYASLK